MKDLAGKLCFVLGGVDSHASGQLHGMGEADKDILVDKECRVSR
jgi:hypothetical protein